MTAVRAFFIALGMLTFALVALAAVVGGLAAAGEELDAWRKRRATDRAAYDAHLAALRDEGTGDVWHRSHECEPTPIFDRVGEWEQKR
jgi:hypothetical protein